MTLLEQLKLKNIKCIFLLNSHFSELLANTFVKT